jgi:hypothetical protein
VPADPPVPRSRDVQRARTTARLWIGLAALFAVLAVLRWLADGDLWGRLLATAAAIAYALIAWGARRRAREAAGRAEAGGTGTPA